jgi:hypothetical protein
LVKLFQAWIHKLPENTVNVGDQISIDSNLVELKVRGATNYRGRDALLINVSGVAAGFGGQLVTSGYGILDARTGLYLYSEVIVRTDGASKERFVGREITRIELPQ